MLLSYFKNQRFQIIINTNIFIKIKVLSIDINKIKSISSSYLFSIFRQSNISRYIIGAVLATNQKGQHFLTNTKATNSDFII
ncbi:hypothetical protein pb186bvf_003047 [Paramecium bursaria]